MSKIVSEIAHLIPDKQYLLVKYYRKTGKKLNLRSPQSFNEKMQWLKLYDRRDVYTTMVDKYEVKKYVAKIIGDEYIVPTLGVYDKFDEIDFDRLPEQFVLKCTHDSGGLVIVRDKNKFDKLFAKQKINKCLEHNYYYSGREWPYKNVKPRIIVEKYLEDKNNKTMRDYKFFCFNGDPRLMYVSEGLENHETAGMSFYDMDFKLTDCKRSDYRKLDYTPDIPKNFDKMKKFSAILSKNIPHVRVDWYDINGQLYFGELTFFTCGGIIPFEDEKWNRKLGDWIDLSLVKK